MAVLNPPIAISANAAHNADDLRGAVAASFLSQGKALGPRPRAGIIPGWGHEYAVVPTDVPGMRVNVRSGQVMVPAPQDGHGGWIVINDADLQVDLAQSHQTSPRTDLIIVRVADTQYTAGGDNSAAVRVITGSAEAGAPVPVVPSTEGAYMVLAQVAVAAGATSITAANITQNTYTARAYTVPVGGLLLVANATARTALTHSDELQVKQLDTGQIWDSINGTWVPRVVGRTDDMTLQSYSFNIYVDNVVITSNGWMSGHGYIHQRNLKAIGHVVQGDGGAQTGNISVDMPFAKKPADADLANSRGMGSYVGTFSWQMRADNGFAVPLGHGVILYNTSTQLGDFYKADGTRFSTTMQYLLGARVNFDYFIQ